MEDRDFNELLLAHNDYRLEVGGITPLVWDKALEDSAAAYAALIAKTGDFKHSPQSTRPGQSENLWLGDLKSTPKSMVSSWASEKSLFRPGIFPNVSTTGDVMDVVHYSQLIWPSSTKLGCAIDRSGKQAVTVCRYSPKGNVDGIHVGHDVNYRPVLPPVVVPPGMR